MRRGPGRGCGRGCGWGWGWGWPALGRGAARRWGAGRGRGGGCATRWVTGTWRATDLRGRSLAARSLCPRSARDLHDACAEVTTRVLSRTCVARCCQPFRISILYPGRPPLGVGASKVLPTEGRVSPTARRTGWAQSLPIGLIPLWLLRDATNPGSGQRHRSPGSGSLWTQEGGGEWGGLEGEDSSPLSGGRGSTV